MEPRDRLGRQPADTDHQEWPASNDVLLRGPRLDVLSGTYPSLPLAEFQPPLIPHLVSPLGLPITQCSKHAWCGIRPANDAVASVPTGQIAAALLCSACYRKVIYIPMAIIIIAVALTLCMTVWLSRWSSGQELLR